MQAAAGQTVDLPTVEAWLNDWVEEKRRSRSAATHIRYEGVIRAFLDSLSKPRRSGLITSLSVADIRKFRDRLISEGRSAATANMAVKIIRTPLNLARKVGYLTHNPAEGLDSLATQATEKGVFSPAQVGAMVTVASRDWKRLILGGYYTGARIGDLSNLAWASVDLERRVICFTQSKTGKEIEIPIHPEFLAWLTATPEDQRNDKVFPTLSGKTTAGRNGLSGQFRLIMKKAGIDNGIIERLGEKGRNRSTLSFHSLRHSFNSAMANAGIPQEMRQRLTGHASKAVNDRYTHAELDTLRKAVDSVPTLG